MACAAGRSWARVRSLPQITKNNNRLPNTNRRQNGFKWSAASQTKDLPGAEARNGILISGRSKTTGLEGGTAPAPLFRLRQFDVRVAVKLGISKFMAWFLCSMLLGKQEGDRETQPPIRATSGSL